MCVWLCVYRRWVAIGRGRSSSSPGFLRRFKQPIYAPLLSVVSTITLYRLFATHGDGMRRQKVVLVISASWHAWGKRSRSRAPQECHCCCCSYTSTRIGAAASRLDTVESCDCGMC